MKVTVYKDVPKAYACNDTFISIDSCLTLKGNVTQSFGFIKKYFWDFEGDGIWDDSSTTTSEVIHSYTTLGDKVVIFGAMDDDGNLSKDTLQVLVGTFLEGAISGNETLTKNQNPFILTGAVTVPSGSQLTIEPGAILLYSKSTILHIDGGAVIANGTPSDSISFSSLFKDDNITFLFFEKADLSKSQLSYLKFVGHDIWIDNIFIYCEKAPNQPRPARRPMGHDETQ